jgi:hypothetical protein
MTYRPSAKALRLAVVLRQAQWEIDDAAYKLPMGIYLPSHCTQLATAMDDVAKVLRDYAESPADHIPLPGDSI